MDDTPTVLASGDDPVVESALVSCLEYLARRLNRTFSRRSVLDGLPVEPGQELTPRLFQRAAARIGLAAKLFERAPSSVPAILLPCIVLLKGGEAAVLINRSRDRRKFQAVFPAVSDKPKWLAASTELLGWSLPSASTERLTSVALLSIHPERGALGGPILRRLGV